MHDVGLILEQKQTKETKNASHCIYRHIYQYQFVKVVFSPGLTHQPRVATGPVRVTIRVAAAVRPERGLADVIREIAAEQRSRGFPGRSAEDLRADDDARMAADADRDRELDAARRRVVGGTLSAARLGHRESRTLWSMSGRDRDRGRGADPGVAPGVPGFRGHHTKLTADGRSGAR
jgi:hypothetical protein